MADLVEKCLEADPLRRFQDGDEIAQFIRPKHVSLTANWNLEYAATRAARKPGGDYYATQATYLGDRFLHLAFARYRGGQLSLEGLARHLRVKARNVARLEDYVFGRK